MLKAIRSLFTLALLLAAGVALAAAEVKPYARDDLASDVVRLTDTLRKETAQIGAKLKGKSAEQLRKDAASAVAAGNYKDAGAWLGAVVAADPKDSASWLALAKLGAAADDAQANGRYDLVERGQTAAYAAYQRATGARAAGRGAGAARQSLRPPRNVAPGARRLPRQPRPPRRRRRAQDLRGHAREARLPHRRLQGRQRIARRRASASTSPSRWRARPTSPPMSRSPARRTRRSRPRTSRSASRASSTASATRSFCARVCLRRSASRCSRTPTTRSTCATARRRRISPAAPMCCRARASSARR